MISKEIPSEIDWEGDSNDLDWKAAHKIFFGKSNDDVQGDFYRCVIERADEIRFMPLKPFQYYILGFRDFVMAGNFMLLDEADAASSFLTLIEAKLEKTPEFVLPVIDELMPAIDYIAENQEEYKANKSIYGDFSEIAKKIKSYR